LWRRIGTDSKYEGKLRTRNGGAHYYGELKRDQSPGDRGAHQDPFTHKWLPEREPDRQCRRRTVHPWPTPTFQAFATKAVTQSTGQADQCGVVEARELRHMLLLNRGGKFEAVPLPVEAHWRPPSGRGSRL